MSRSHRIFASRRYLGTERLMCLAVPVNVNQVSALRDSSRPCRILRRHRLNFEIRPLLREET